MDSLKNFAEGLLQRNEEYQKECEDDIIAFEAKLTAFCNQLKSDGKSETPKQIKKRAKRLQATKEEVETNASSTDNTPELTSKSNNVVSDESRNNMRPVRTARSKMNYKELSRHVKLRQPVELAAVQVKEETLSRASTSTDAGKKSNSSRNSNDEGFVSTATSQNEIEQNKNEKVDNNSLEIIPNLPEVVDLDSEDEVIAEEKKTRKKRTTTKKSVLSKIETVPRSTRSKAKFSVASSSRPETGRTSRAKVANKEKPIVHQVKQEREPSGEMVKNSLEVENKMVTRCSAASEQSIYEDAISDIQNLRAVVVLDRLSLDMVQNNNATSAAIIPAVNLDSTFCITNKTFVSGENRTFVEGPADNQSDSILTEDISDNEEDVHTKSTSQNSNSNAGSSGQQRSVKDILSSATNAENSLAIDSSTLPKTKSRMLSGVTPSQLPRLLAKSATPLAMVTNYKKDATPSNVPLPAQSSSTSKLMSMKKQLSADTETTKQSDEVKKMLSSDKRKKMEEKQRLAQQYRDQMEKEKRELAEKTVREREEKHRKIMMEKEEKLRLEREQKLTKDAARKEFLQKRREEQQRLLMEERQNVEQLKIESDKASRALQAHYSKNVLSKKKSSFDEDQDSYSFDMLQTDDSTDDENKPNAKRPPIPSWSRRHQRQPMIEAQSFVSSAVVDAFFSVAPMTPNLAEIFPQIDPDKLRRNSSAVWRTPPRYSQMPKY